VAPIMLVAAMTPPSGRARRLTRVFKETPWAVVERILRAMRQ
jgi:hypothetical protein